MCSRKDYEAIAKVVADSKIITPSSETASSNATRAYIAKEVAKYFAQDNTRFDRERFLKACDMPED